MGSESTAKAAEAGVKVTPLSVSLDKIDLDYRIEGDAYFRPVRVLNDGDRVIMEMPAGIRSQTSPIFMLTDEDGNPMIVNYHPHEDPVTGKTHYIVHKLFVTGELRAGKERVKIIWNRKSPPPKSSWFFGG